ncbi:MAG: hypothetical protein PWP31_1071 [Clostridia bacterium]|nr:hypothetical protein [Clostridia bacterium]
MLSELIVALTLIGTLVGAGFASGQELVQFFLTLGNKAPQAIVLMGVLLSIEAFMVRSLALRWRTSSYHDFFINVLGNWYLIADIIITAFLFGGFCIMLAGAGSVAKHYLGLTSFIGSLICGGLALIACLGRGRGIFTLNFLLVPVMLVIIIMIGCKNLPSSQISIMEIPAKGLVTTNWIINAFLYVTYNMVTGMVLLTSLPSSKNGAIGAAIGSIVLAALAFLLIIVLSQLSLEGLQKELPLLYFVSEFQPNLKNLYAIVLLLAMITTATGDLYGLAERLGKIPHLTPQLVAIILLLIALPLTNLGFTSLIAWIYPVFGYLGLFVVILSLKRILGNI